MKAEQSSLYRHLERLHLWCLETFANAPKEPAVQEDIRLFLENTINAQSAVELALNEPSPRQKSDLLDVVSLSMSNVRTIAKALTEYSSFDSQNRHVITKGRRVVFLDLMYQIGNELGRWRKKTAREIEEQKAASPSK